MLSSSIVKTVGNYGGTSSLGKRLTSARLCCSAAQRLADSGESNEPPHVEDPDPERDVPARSGCRLSAMASIASDPHLVGAYGEFWYREEVAWGKGRAWQLLGWRGGSRSTKVCDIRYARGIYVLHDAHGPVYVGMARGQEALGERLTDHDKKRSDWERFSWYSFDDTRPNIGDRHWDEVVERSGRNAIDADTASREMEALVINALGTWRYGQNEMGFDRGRTHKWEQITGLDTYKDGRLARLPDKTPSPTGA